MQGQTLQGAHLERDVAPPFCCGSIEIASRVMRSGLRTQGAEDAKSPEAGKPPEDVRSPEGGSGSGSGSGRGGGSGRGSKKPKMTWPEVKDAVTTSLGISASHTSMVQVCADRPRPLRTICNLHVLVRHMHLFA